MWDFFSNNQKPSWEEKINRLPVVSPTVSKPRGAFSWKTYAGSLLLWQRCQLFFHTNQGYTLNLGNCNTDQSNCSPRSSQFCSRSHSRKVRGKWDKSVGCVCMWWNKPEASHIPKVFVVGWLSVYAVFILDLWLTGAYEIV